MVVNAIVQDGVIRLPEGIELPNGAAVELIVPETRVTDDGSVTLPRKRKSFAERYARYIGDAEDMPSDLAENHDHYLHGSPKR